MELILASTSPRRRELLTEAGYDFRVVPPDDQAECGVCSRETPPELVGRLAWQKAADVVQHLQQGLVIGCDTVAECDGTVLGKPQHREHAQEMLTRLAGRVHRVYSGLCLCHVEADRHQIRVAKTTLRMLPITEADIQEYLDTGLWEGKAGAFGFQDRTGWLEVVEGSESNVVGLPLELLAEMLTEFEYQP